MTVAGALQLKLSDGRRVALGERVCVAEEVSAPPGVSGRLLRATPSMVEGGAAVGGDGLKDDAVTAAGGRVAESAGDGVGGRAVAVPDTRVGVGGAVGVAEGPGGCERVAVLCVGGAWGVEGVGWGRGDGVEVGRVRGVRDGVRGGDAPRARVGVGAGERVGGGTAVTDPRGGGVAVQDRETRRSWLPVRPRDAEADAAVELRGTRSVGVSEGDEVGARAAVCHWGAVGLPEREAEGAAPESSVRLKRGLGEGDQVCLRSVREHEHVTEVQDGVRGGAALAGGVGVGVGVAVGGGGVAVVGAGARACVSGAGGVGGGAVALGVGVGGTVVGARGGACVGAGDAVGFGVGVGVNGGGRVDGRVHVGVGASVDAHVGAHVGVDARAGADGEVEVGAGVEVGVDGGVRVDVRVGVRLLGVLLDGVVAVAKDGFGRADAGVDRVGELGVGVGARVDAG